MLRTLVMLCMALALRVTVSQAQLMDDFSHGDWQRSSSTPGQVVTEPGKLHLIDAPKAPDWITASKVFTVDVDETPFFVTQVTALSDRGTVKLIRKKPFDKRVALEIDRPGVYTVDLRKFGWQGTTAIETCLYAIGAEEEITYGYVKYAARLTEQEQQHIQRAAAGGNVKLQVQPFEVVPLFHTCSYYVESPARSDLTVTYRREGGAWQEAYPPVYVPEDGMYRGSLVNLEEDTTYQLKISDNQALLAQTTFRTWAGQVPIAKTVTLKASTFDGCLTVTESGTPQGWIKITAQPGDVLRNDHNGPLLDLSRVKYVLLEGMTLRGGLEQVIRVNRCEHIRIVNCDIAGWGRIGTQRFDLDGKFYTDSGRAINWDSAILIRRSVGTVVERCYIHDPVSTANSWYLSHPAGPQAVGMGKSPSTVLRYNDFIGSDLHRWNDAVEGEGNFHLDGGFHRDGDVYGNLMCFANDDALEIDGGQTNVRVFDNKFEGCLCGVSIQGCMSGPSYVFRNLMVKLGDERGLAGQTIKTSSHANGPSATSFLFYNTCWGPSSDLTLRDNLRIVAKNNIFAGRRAIGGRQQSPQSDCGYNLLAAGDAKDEPHSVEGDPGFVDSNNGLFGLTPHSPAAGRAVTLDPFAVASGTQDLGAVPLNSNRLVPVRPIPVSLDRAQLNFTANDLHAGRSRTVTTTVTQPGFSSRYRIAQNDAFDWFTVQPASGTLSSNTSQVFTVTLDPKRMGARKKYRGVFLIRLENGLSRPVMVYARTDVVSPIQPAHTGDGTIYREAEALQNPAAYTIGQDHKASGGHYLHLAQTDSKEAAVYTFKIPRNGLYFVALRVRSDQPIDRHDTIRFAWDDAPLESTKLRSDSSWTWSLAAHNQSMSLICLQGFELTAGEHTLRLAPRESLDLDLIALTDTPERF